MGKEEGIWGPRQGPFTPDLGVGLCRQWLLLVLSDPPASLDTPLSFPQLDAQCFVCVAVAYRWTLVAVGVGGEGCTCVCVCVCFLCTWVLMSVYGCLHMTVYVACECVRVCSHVFCVRDPACASVGRSRGVWRLVNVVRLTPGEDVLG